MKAAVVYYSLEGNTKFAAQKIAEKLGADLIEINPVKAYPTGKVSKFFWGGKSSTMKEEPELEPYSFQPEDYELVIVGSPLWAWKITPPLRTFLKSHDLATKKVAAFMSCGGGDTAKAMEEIRVLSGQKELAARLVMVEPLKKGNNVDKQIKGFCEKLNQNST